MSELLECKVDEEIKIPRSIKLFPFVLECYKKHPIRVLEEYGDSKELLVEFDYYMIFVKSPVDAEIKDRILNPAAAYKKWLVTRGIYFDILEMINGSLVKYAALEILHDCDYSSMHDNEYEYVGDLTSDHKFSGDNKLMTSKQLGEIGFREHNILGQVVFTTKVINVNVNGKEVTAFNIGDKLVVCCDNKSFTFNKIPQKSHLELKHHVLSTRVNNEIVSMKDNDAVTRKTLVVPLGELSHQYPTYMMFIKNGFNVLAC